MAKLLTEVNENVQYLIEDNGGKKDYYISGIFAQCETPNRNGRIYPRAVLEGQINQYMAKVNTNRALGELNHPNCPTVDLNRVSHMITELYFDGNDVRGKAKILSNQTGQNVKALIDDGVSFGVSTRGLGSLKPVNGLNEVQGDFMLTAIDIVSDPSAPGAWVSPLSESLDWVMRNGEWVAVDHNKIIRQKEYHKLVEFVDFVSKL